jgi:hypothetical protein
MLPPNGAEAGGSWVCGLYAIKIPYASTPTNMPFPPAQANSTMQTGRINTSGSSDRHRLSAAARELPEWKAIVIASVEPIDTGSIWCSELEGSRREWAAQALWTRKPVVPMVQVVAPPCV